MRAALLTTVTLAGLFLTGCAPLPVYYREGTDPARLEQDRATCQARALAEAPVRMRQRYIPPVYDYQSVCTPAGCGTYRFVISPGRYESYDTNEGRRAEAVKACMAEKGYARVSLPACDSQTTAQAARAGAPRAQPPITEQSCIVRLKSGMRWIHTP